MSQQQRVILITGASSGIGRTCAIALSKTASLHPLVLILSGRRQSELEATAESCKSSSSSTEGGVTTEVCAGDVSNDSDVKKMFGMVKEKYGRLDLLFNNAGIDLLNSVPLEEADMSLFRKVLDVNVMAAVLCTAEAIKIMKEQSPKGGRIVNNGSISASAPRPNSAAYTVSKHAILGLTRSTSLDGRKYSITATQLDIGNAATALGAHAGKGKGSVQADGERKVEPMMDVENVGKVLVFLAGLDISADVLNMNILASGMPFVGRG